MTQHYISTTYQSNTNSSVITTQPKMSSTTTTKELKTDLSPLIRVYTDGSVERLWGPPTVPATLEDPETGVASKDITLSPTTNLIARLHLPKLTQQNQKLPIVVYFHGGGFCLKSAFSSTEHRYMNFLATEAHALIVNVEYRLAPEHPLPAAYNDGWTALNSLASVDEPWITNHGNLNTIFVGGDSAGANIAHNLAMRAGSETLNNGIKLRGIYLCHPYFLGPKRVGTRDPKHDMGFNKERAYDTWELAYPGAGPNHYMINPSVKDAPSLKDLGCEKVLVITGENDDIVDWGVLYYNGLKESGYGGNVDLFEVKDEGHSFQVFNPTCENAKLMIQCLASFFHS